MNISDIYVATNNIHKLREIEKIATNYGFTVKPLYNLKYEIQSDELDDVALASAIFAYIIVKKPILVEDAGLFINALNGFPGAYSSFVYKTIGIKGILKLLENAKDRTACFRSVAVLVYDGKVYIGKGTTCGYITEEPRGNKGFGFDPIFIPSEHGERRTFAEMDIEEKNKYSHRAKAVASVFEQVLVDLRKDLLNNSQNINN